MFSAGLPAHWTAAEFPHDACTGPAWLQNGDMSASGRLTYPARPAGRGPEKMLLHAAASVFHAAFGVFGIAAIVGGAVSGNAAPVIFGVLWTVAYGAITWNSLHLASYLEFSGGRLWWRSSLPWSPRMRPGRVRAFRWPASARSRYVRIELGDGRKLSVLPRPGLMEFIRRVHRAEPAVVVDVRPGGRMSTLVSAEPSGYLQQVLRSAAAHRSVQVGTTIVVSFLMLGFVAQFGLLGIGAQENFQTLRSDLANVHLPSGYRLAAEHQVGTGCAHEQCSLTQTWVWAPGSRRTRPTACSDAYHAMTSAFSGVDSNSPLPDGASCDYYAVLASLLHPGQGKRDAEAIVQAGPPRTNDGFVIKLTDSYG